MANSTSNNWAGPPGDEYTKRNKVSVADRQKFFESLPIEPRNTLEIGCNTGANLAAWEHLGTLAWGVDVNHNAVAEAQRSGLRASTTWPHRDFDLVFTMGCLIHIDPDDLLTTVGQMYKHSSRYILMAEYFRPEFTELPYRDGLKLWAGDYGRFLSEWYKVMLIDQGFAWKQSTGLDNLTWWLFEKA